MFRAINKTTQKDITPIDVYPSQEKLEPIRELSNNRDLICPLCKQDVILKAGLIRIWHLAHLKGHAFCVLAKEDKKLLLARLALYNFFKTKEKKLATLKIEYSVKGVIDHRPFDCYIEVKVKGKIYRHGYYILHNQKSFKYTPPTKYSNKVIVHYILAYTPEQLSKKLIKHGFMTLQHREYRITKRTKYEYESIYESIDQKNEKKKTSLNMIVVDNDSARFYILRGIRDSYYNPYHFQRYHSFKELKGLCICPTSGDFVTSGEAKFFKELANLQVQKNEEEDEEVVLKSQKQKENDEWTKNFKQRIQQKNGRYKRDRF